MGREELPSSQGATSYCPMENPLEEPGWDRRELLHGSTAAPSPEGFGRAKSPLWSSHPKKTFCAHQGPQLGDPSPLSQSRPQGGSHQEPAGARPGNTQLGLELILPSCPSPQPEHNVWGTAAPFSRCCWKATRSRKAGAGIWLLHKKGSDGSSSPANTNPAGTARPRLFGMFPCVPVLKNPKEKSFPSSIALGKRFP